MFTNTLGTLGTSPDCACIRAPCDCSGGGSVGEPTAPRPMVDPAPEIQVHTLDRTATLGDIATLGGVLSMLFFVLRVR